MTRRILLVEDTEDNREIVRDLMDSVGYELLRQMTAQQVSAWPRSHLRGCGRSSLSWPSPSPLLVLHCR
jgi:CheY-like chemotaxis protein